MWMLENQTPFEAERTWVRDKDGRHHWIVVIKATYDIQDDGSLELAEDPVPPLHAPEFMGAYGESSLRYEADLVAMKGATDIYLNGIAYAPSGQRVTELNVAFQIDGLRKELTVYGDRIWQRSMMGGIQPSPSVPFVTMPIIYEKAFGGYDAQDPNPKKHKIDFKNPVGSGIAIDDDTLLGKPAPSIVDRTQKEGKGRPAGFGAIASFWSPRKEHAGTYDESWEKQRKPLLPGDYNPMFLQCAPEDQRTAGYLKGGNQVGLSNLTPSGWTRFTIPRHEFEFVTFFGTDKRPHSGELVSVIINSDGPQLILVWQSSLPCGNDGEYLDKTIIRLLDKRT